MTYQHQLTFIVAVDWLEVGGGILAIVLAIVLAVVGAGLVLKTLEWICFAFEERKPAIPGQPEYRAPMRRLTHIDREQIEKMCGGRLPESLVSLYQNVNVLSATYLPLPVLKPLIVYRLFPPSELVAVKAAPPYGLSVERDEVAVGLCASTSAYFYVKTSYHAQADAPLYAYDFEYDLAEELPSIRRLTALWLDFLKGHRGFSPKELEDLQNQSGGRIPAALCDFYALFESGQKFALRIPGDRQRLRLRLFHPAEVVMFKQEAQAELPSELVAVAQDETLVRYLCVKVGNETQKDAPVVVLDTCDMSTVNVAVSIRDLITSCEDA